MPGQVIEVFFLSEDVPQRRLFAPRESPEHNGRIHLSRQLGAPLGIHTVGFTFAPLLCRRRRNLQKHKNASAPGNKPTRFPTRLNFPRTFHFTDSLIHTSIFFPSCLHRRLNKNSALYLTGRIWGTRGPPQHPAFHAVSGAP